MAVALVLTLTSCLRDATPAVLPAETDETEIVTQADDVMESVSINTTEAVETTEPAETEPHSEVVKWSERHGSAADVIMTPEQIESENVRIMAAVPKMVDILDVPEYISADELRGMIEEESIPTLPRYDADDSEITAEHTWEVSSNMALDLIGDYSAVRLGVAVSRANLRSIPDDKPYRTATDNPYDSIQRTEIVVGTPVWVLHSSRDNEYLFIRSYNYYGWVKAVSIATTEDSGLWEKFASPEEFVCVTSPLISVSGENVDMGAVLPYVSTGSNGYTVSVPKRDAGGKLVYMDGFIDLGSGSVGYLPYTFENYLIQAFKYEGTPYGWGGLDNGVDCSGFVANVFGCFGFRFPRDTKDQNSVVGTAVNVTDKSHADVSDALLATDSPTAVYYPGHTLLYLGYDDDNRRYYFIHAPKIGEKVSVTTKKDLKGMTYIGEVCVP